MGTGSFSRIVVVAKASQKVSRVSERSQKVHLVGRSQAPQEVLLATRSQGPQEVGVATLQGPQEVLVFGIAV